MKRKFKLKINGNSPRGIFLAFILANLKCDVYLNDCLKDSNLVKDYQIFLFSNYSRNLLSKFDIWDEIEDVSYGFNSLMFKDNFVSEQFLLRTENSSNKYLNTIGWIANYSDIKNILINKLINFDNVHIISEKHLNDESFIFDYEFDFKNFDKMLNLFKLPLSIFKRIEEKVLIFNIYLRGHIDKRIYEINTTEGLLILTPISQNLYQVIWNNPSFKIKETSLSSKSFFIDNLTTLLPSELKIDQIIGDINHLNVMDTFTTYLIRNKSLYFNENKFNSNTFFQFNFDTFLWKISQIYKVLEKDELRNTKILYKVGFYYLLRKYIEIKINFSLFNSLFSLLKINNVFSLFLRKLLFNILKRIKFTKFFFMRNLNI
tara:strand:- start:1982 stop:3103 length:1122 start_codon:yes stop_codon:yes gene_type:complete